MEMRRGRYLQCPLPLVLLTFYWVESRFNLRYCRYAVLCCDGLYAGEQNETGWGGERLSRASPWVEQSKISKLRGEKPSDFYCALSYAS